MQKKEQNLIVMIKFIILVVFISSTLFIGYIVFRFKILLFLALTGVFIVFFIIILLILYVKLTD